MFVIVALATVLIVSLVAPLALKPLLLRMGVIDVPNSRSSHTRPVIRGVGLAPLLAVVVGYVILLFGAHGSAQLTVLLVILGVSLAAGLLGWVEDFRGLPVVVRAGLQLAIGLVGACAITANDGGSWWAVLAYALGVAAYINVTNFMDGVNGISGLHGVVVGVTYATLGVIVEAPWLTVAGLILALAFAGFLPWNLIRGGMFLGDVGSYLLGGGIAIVAVAALAHGVLAVAVLGPIVIYLADAGVTLVRRVLRGERWFEAHRSHVYQRLIDLGLSHAQVASIVATASACTGGLGLLVALSPAFWFGAVVLMVVVVTGYFLLGTALGRMRQYRAIVRQEGTSR